MSSENCFKIELANGNIILLNKYNIYKVKFEHRSHCVNCPQGFKDNNYETSCDLSRMQIKDSCPDYVGSYALYINDKEDCVVCDYTQYDVEKFIDWLQGRK